MENEISAVIYRFFKEIGLDMTDEQIERTIEFFNDIFNDIYE